MTIKELKQELEFATGRREDTVSRLLAENSIKDLKDSCYFLFQDYLIEGGGFDYAAELIRLCRAVIPEEFPDLLDIDLFGEPPLNLHSLFGALVDLKLGDEDFWKAAFVSLPPEMKTLAVSGLFNIRHELGIQAIEELPDTEDIAAAVYVILCYYKPGTIDFAPLEKFPPQIRATIKEYCEESWKEYFKNPLTLEKSIIN